MGSGKTTNITQATDVKTPWGPQQEYLTGAFAEAKQIYDTQKAQNDPGYQGDFYAQPRPEQIQSYQNSIDFSNNQGREAYDRTLNNGGILSQLGLLGSAGAQGGLASMTGDQTQNNLNAAGAYSNNPDLSGMVDASMRDARRQVYEQALPEMNRAAAATGNMNSSRAGVAQGVLERGLAEKAMDVSSQMRGAAWQDGLGRAQQDFQARAGIYGAMGQQGSSLAQLGTNASQTGVNMAKDNAIIASLGNEGMYTMDQNRINNELAKIDYTQAKPWTNLQNYWNVVGDKSWGGTTTSTGTSIQRTQASPMSTIGSVVGALGSFLCDERLKTNIVKVGELKNGIGLYTFVYINDPEKLVRFGPMAQEVEKTFPDLVHEAEDGFKVVNFAGLIARAMEI